LRSALFWAERFFWLVWRPAGSNSGSTAIIDQCGILSFPFLGRVIIIEPLTPAVAIMKPPRTKLPGGLKFQQRGSTFFVPLLALVVWHAAAPILWATTISTPASISATYMVYGIEQCLESGMKAEHVEFQDVVERVSLEGAGNEAIASLMDRFQWLGARGPLVGTAQAKLMALSSYRIRKGYLGPSGRYLILHQKGRVSYQWQNEDEVEKMLQAAGIPLETKGVWRQRSTFLADAMQDPAGLALLASPILVALWLWAHLRGKRLERELWGERHFF
jgi:hypothetical protein